MVFFPRHWRSNRITDDGWEVLPPCIQESHPGIRRSLDVHPFHLDTSNPTLTAHAYWAAIRTSPDMSSGVGEFRHRPYPSSLHSPEFLLSQDLSPWVPAEVAAPLQNPMLFFRG